MPEQQLQINLKDIFATMGELYYDFRCLKTSLNMANASVKQLSEQLQKETEKNKTENYDCEK